MIAFGNVPAGSVLPIFFPSYGKTSGESITLTGLAVTDVEIYKGTSMTQRASDAGVALIDTDGIDIDGITGIHGFSIDLSDNTDASFYSIGSFFTVVVSAVTVDSQVVNFIAATFRIVAAEAIAGKPKADVDGFGGVAGTFSSGRPEVNATQVGGENVSSPGTAYPFGVLDQGTAQAASATTLQLRSAAGFADDELIGATILITGGTTGVGQRAIITDYVGATDTATVPTWTVTPTGTITYKIFASAAGMQASDIGAAVLAAAAASPITANATQWGGTAVASAVILAAANIATDAITAAKLAADAGTEIGTAVWASVARTLTAGGLNAADVRAAIGLASANLDTQLDALPTAVENAAAVIAAAQADPIHANVEEVNNVQLQGAGTVANQWRPA